MNAASQRVLQADGKALIVALDHIPVGFMQGWEEPGQTIQAIIDGAPDGLMTTYGILKQFGPHLAGEMATLLRLDGGPTYLLESWPDFSRWDMLYSVEDALRLGAEGVITNLLLGSRVELDTIRICAQTAAACTRLGLCCTVEALPVEGPAIKNPFDPELVAYASRLAAELGADMVKTYYTGDPSSFADVVRRCPVPVLTAGGPKVDRQTEITEAVAGMLQAGGRGIFIGRNAWGYSQPARLLQQLRQLIHPGQSARHSS
jgi:DhnA family fructose-bisphosphate aldolase class Ia